MDFAAGASGKGGISKKYKKKKRKFKQEIQRRVRANHNKMAKMHTNIIGDVSWLDRLKAWSKVNLSHTSNLVLEKMIAKGYRFPLPIGDAGRTSSAELCAKGVTVNVEGYILISKKQKVLKIVE